MKDTVPSHLSFCAHYGRCLRSANVTDRLHAIGIATSKTSLDLAQHSPLGALEVAVHKTYKKYQTPLISKNASSISRGGLLNDTPAWD